MSALPTSSALAATTRSVVMANSASTSAMADSAGRAARLGERVGGYTVAALPLEIHQRATPDRHLGLCDRGDRCGDQGVRVGHVGDHGQPHLGDAVAMGPVEPPVATSSALLPSK